MTDTTQGPQPDGRDPHTSLSRHPALVGLQRPTSPYRARAEIDPAAIAANTEALRRHVGGRDLMAVVKAHGYGHGTTEAARAAREGGATWIGTAYLDEALHLRSAGDTGRLLAWMSVPGDPLDAAVAADVDLGVASIARLYDVAWAAERQGSTGRIHIGLDTGMGRGGATLCDAGAMIQEAARLRDRGLVEVVGVMSHLANADNVGDEHVQTQIANFEEGVGMVLAAGFQPEHLHLANSAATISCPESWFTMVRPGIALYGVTPFGDDATVRRYDLSLRPAMRLTAPVAQTKRVPAGQPVSYGGTYVTRQETTLAVVPLGYADGIPRQASSKGEVAINGACFTVAGRVCMDQFVVDVGDAEVEVNDEVVVIGDATQGEPSAQSWAVAADTIGYDVVTGIGSRVARTYGTRQRP